MGQSGLGSLRISQEPLEEASTGLVGREVAHMDRDMYIKVTETNGAGEPDLNKVASYEKENFISDNVSLRAAFTCQDPGTPHSVVVWT